MKHPVILLMVLSAFSAGIFFGWILGGGIHRISPASYAFTLQIQDGKMVKSVDVIIEPKNLVGLEIAK